MKDFDELIDNLDFDSRDEVESAPEETLADDELQRSFTKLKSIGDYFEQVNREMDSDLALNISVDFGVLLRIKGLSCPFT